MVSFQHSSCLNIFPCVSELVIVLASAEWDVFLAHRCTVLSSKAPLSIQAGCLAEHSNYQLLAKLPALLAGALLQAYLAAGRHQCYQSILVGIGMFTEATGDGHQHGSPYITSIAAHAHSAFLSSVAICGSLSLTFLCASHQRFTYMLGVDLSSEIYSWQK